MKITKNMSIAEVLDLCPDSMEIMMDVGLHCVGCGGASMETLEEGMLGHGFAQKDLDSLLKKINDSMCVSTEEKTPIEPDFFVEEIKEGNKVYRKLGGLLFSQKAFNSLHELAKEEKFFQIRIDIGGCSGYSYKYDFVKKAEDDEKAYKLSDHLTIFMNNFSFDKLYGSIVDFETGLHGSGLKFVNPNEKNSCHCGSSVGF